jgi:hypothetical protein
MLQFRMMSFSIAGRSNFFAVLQDISVNRCRELPGFLFCLQGRKREKEGKMD